MSKQVETYVVVDVSGGRFFFDDIEAVTVFARALRNDLKGVYRVIMEVKAWEKVDYETEQEPDWDAIRERVDREQSEEYQRFVERYESDVDTGADTDYTECDESATARTS